MTMTDPQKSPANQRQPSASASLTWKSGLLAVSLAVVMAGSALVARFDQSAQGAQTAQAVEATSTPAPTQTEVQTQGQQPARLAPLPARPLFQQPVTRTRRS
ncbi:MAG: hypothetical protein WAV79_20415 [Anaerolineae bacterium]